MSAAGEERIHRLDVNAKILTKGRVAESPRELPVRGRWDVVVCGGGPAGVGAALAAGRAGARVLMIERWGFPGGMWTAGLVNPFFEWRYRGFIVADLVKRLVEAGAFEKWCGSYCFRPEVMKLALEAMLAEANVELLYYTLAVDSIVVDGRVAGVVVESKAGREAVLGEVIVDATGDGDIAARAGCGFAFGRESDGVVQPMTLMFEVRNINGWMRRDAPDLYDRMAAALAASDIESDMPFPKTNAAPYIITLPGGDAAAVQATHVYRLNPLSPSDLTAGTIDARRQAHELVRLLRMLPELSDLEMTASAPSLGLRESRRVSGRYRLTVDDLRAGSRFDDAVCSAAFPVDVHEPSPGSGVATHADMAMKPYEIPYRCLLPADVRGLLLAGRCISGDHLAHASYRVTGTMMAVGQAAGMAAAQAAATGCDPSEIDGAALRTELRAKGARFLADGARFRDGGRE